MDRLREPAHEKCGERRKDGQPAGAVDQLDRGERQHADGQWLHNDE